MAQTIEKQPSVISSFNAPQWYVVSESSLTPNYRYKFRVDQINPDNLQSVVTLGVYSIPPNTSGKGVFSPHEIVKQAYKTTKKFNGFDGVNPAKQQIVLYNVATGYERDLNVVFLMTTTATYASTTVLKLIFINVGNPLVDIEVGDEITIDKYNKQFNPQYDGRAKVVGKTTYTLTLNIPYGVALPSGLESGKITKTMRMNPIEMGNSRWAINSICPYGIENNFVTNINNSRILFDYDGYKSILPNQEEVVTYKSNVSPVYVPTNLTWNAYDQDMVLLETFNEPAAPGITLSINLHYNAQVGTRLLEDRLTTTDIDDVYFYKVTIPNIGEVKRSIQKECFNDYIRFAFINTLGGWSFWNFDTKKKVENTNITRVEYGVALPYDYNIGDREIGISNINTTTEYEATSGWLTEYDYNYIKQILISPEVYIVDETTGFNYPVIITDSQWTSKSYKIDKVINLVLKYKMAYHNNTQTT